MQLQTVSGECLELTVAPEGLKLQVPSAVGAREFTLAPEQANKFLDAIAGIAEPPETVPEASLGTSAELPALVPGSVPTPEELDAQADAYVAGMDDTSCIPTSEPPDSEPSEPTVLPDEGALP